MRKTAGLILMRQDHALAGRATMAVPDFDDGGWRTAALHQPASVDGLLKIVATPFLAAGSWSSM